MNRQFVLHQLRDGIRSVGADVVFLQEVVGQHTSHAQRWRHYPEQPHYEFLADNLWPQFAYGRNAVYRHGHHGNAILSKFPVVHFENHDVSIRGPERRGVLHCVLDLPQPTSTEPTKQLHAFCAHLGLLGAHRTRQTQMICDLLHAKTEPAAPVVLAGDFNDWRGRANQELAHGARLQEVFVQAYGRTPRTYPAHLPVLSLDRIYVRNVRACRPLVLPRRPWAQLSDHVPLAASFEV